MSDEEKVVFVYSTFPDMAAAERAGRALVEGRLAGCVNILPGMVSLYAWQGAVERDSEVVMIAKTRESLAEAAMEAVRQTHPYDVPALLVLPLAGGGADYLAWLRQETEAAP